MVLRTTITLATAVLIGTPVQALDPQDFIDLVIADALTLGLEAESRPKIRLDGEDAIVSELVLFEPLAPYLADFAASLHGFDTCPHTLCADVAGGAIVEGLSEAGDGYSAQRVSASDISILNLGLGVEIERISLAPAHLGSPADGTNGLLSASPMLDFALHHVGQKPLAPGAYPSTLEIENLTLEFDGDTLMTFDSLVQETMIEADQETLHDEITVTGIVIDQSSQTTALSSQPQSMTNAFAALRSAIASQAWDADGSGDAVLELDFGDHGTVRMAARDYVLPFEAFLGFAEVDGYFTPSSYFTGSTVRSATIQIDPGIFELAGEDLSMLEAALLGLAATAPDAERRADETAAVDRFVAGDEGLEITFAVDRPVDIEKLLDKLSGSPMRLLSGNLRAAITIASPA